MLFAGVAFGLLDDHFDQRRAGLKSVFVQIRFICGGETTQLLGNFALNILATSHEIEGTEFNDHGGLDQHPDLPC